MDVLQPQTPQVHFNLMLSFIVKRPVFKLVRVKITLEAPVQMLKMLRLKAAVTPGYRCRLLPIDASTFVGLFLARNSPYV